MIRYGKLPLVLGIYELQLPRLTPGLQRDIEEYEREAFGAALHTRKTTQMRTVPVDVAIAPERQVSTCDDIRRYVREAPGPFATMPCICRHGKDLLGEPCRQTTVRENCLTLGVAASSMVTSGAARFVTRDALLQLIDDADREGLVLQPENTQRPSFICCCCGCCCGVLTTAKRLPEPATFFSANYYATVDEARCEGCGTCLSRCQMDAVCLDTGKAAVLRSHCIGCGLCVTACPSEAVHLLPTERQRIPPSNTGALYAQIYRDRYGTLGLAAAAAKRLLGLKV
jgi:formate hydrogenlyase subunit 6/NADH:ubiquinone oxidoreductase subunit I